MDQQKQHPQTAAAAAAPPATTTYVYEHRSKCSTLAVVQTILYALSCIVAYEWIYFPLLGFVVGICGIYGTRDPAIRRKYVSFYYFGNIFLLVVHTIWLVLFAVLVVSSSSSFAHLSTAVLIVAFLVEALWTVIAALAMQSAKKLRAELLRYPQAVVVMA